MEILTTFLASKLGIAALGVAAGLVVGASAYFSKRVAKLPALAAVKHKYPVLDLVLNIAAQQLTETPYGFLFDAAKAIWDGEGLSPADAELYAQKMADKFDVEKYLGTNWAALSAEQIAQGKSVAVALGLDVDTFSKVAEGH